MDSNVPPDLLKEPPLKIRERREGERDKEGRRERRKVTIESAKPIYCSHLSLLLRLLSSVLSLFFFTLSPSLSPNFDSSSLTLLSLSPSLTLSHFLNPS
jgi:hypothetical protein